MTMIRRSQSITLLICCASSILSPFIGCDDGATIADASIASDSNVDAAKPWSDAAQAAPDASVEASTSQDAQSDSSETDSSAPAGDIVASIDTGVYDMYGPNIFGESIPNSIWGKHEAELRYLNTSFDWAYSAKKTEWRFEGLYAQPWAQVLVDKQGSPTLNARVQIRGLTNWVLLNGTWQRMSYDGDNIQAGWQNGNFQPGEYHYLIRVEDCDLRYG